MSTPPPVPGPTGKQISSPDNIVQQFAYLAGNKASSTGKPEDAFSEYGPGSRTIGEYQHGTSPLIHTRKVADMEKDYYGWSDAQKQDFRAKLGLLNKAALTATDDQIAQQWGNYVQQSANYYAGGQTVSPWDILAKDIATQSGPLASQAGTKTQTTSDVSLTSKLDSDAIFKSAAQSLLGRAPTASEAAQFQQLLNAQEAANPTQSTITTTTDQAGNTTNQSRVQSGGVSTSGAQLLAQQQANKNPEAGAYQAATTYMNALLGLVRQGPV